ncbi:MAG: hypothetical protein KDJ15_07680 [Alphaproteobacteria bacterium]|nr:hypothetical protein [Alphaproteobacteria bacterium]
MRSCEPAPPYPGDNITQKDVAAWSARLWYAHKDCRSKLEAVGRALQQPTEKK